MRTRVMVGGDQKEVQKDYEKLVWIKEKTWFLWLKGGGKMGITIFIK